MKPTMSNIPNAGVLTGPLYQLKHVESTQDEARRLTEALGPLEPAPGGEIRHLLSVSAGFQSGGRGRRGRIWQAAADSSVLVSSAFCVPDAASAARIGFLSALAVAFVAEKCSGTKASVKWPNDVRMNRAKLAGVLVESFLIGPVRVAVAGTGINVLKAPLPGTVCLRDFCEEVDTRTALHQFLGFVDSLLQAENREKEESELARRLVFGDEVVLVGGEPVEVRGACSGRLLVKASGYIKQVPFQAIASPSLVSWEGRPPGLRGRS